MESSGVFREGDGVAPLPSEPTDLARRLLHVEERQDAAGYEAIGIARAPFVDMPVVVRLDHDFVHGLIRALVEHLTREAGPIGEVEAGQRSPSGHITYSLVHVVTTRAHFAVTGRVHVVHLWRLAGYRVQPKVPTLLVAVPPLLETVLVRFDPGATSRYLAGT